jgi:histone H1/5
MQLRCTYCQTMFGIGREETLAALEYMDENHLIYYDAHCPKCRRANRVERFKLEWSYPGWRQAIQEMAKQAATSGTGQAAATPPPAAAAPPASPAAAVPPKKKKTHTRAADRQAAASPKGKKPAFKPSPKAKAKASASKGKASPKGKKPAAKPSPKGKKPAGTRKK